MTDDGGWLTPEERERQQESLNRAWNKVSLAEATDEQRVGVVLAGQVLMVAGLVAAAWVSQGRAAVVIPVVLVLALGLGVSFGIARAMRSDQSPLAQRYLVRSVLIGIAGIVAVLLGTAWAS